MATTKKRVKKKKSSDKEPDTNVLKKKNQLTESKTLNREAEEVETEEEEGKAEFFRENP